MFSRNLSVADNGGDTDFTVVLTGNPNVGKSTVFNALTGLKHHTGNWTGKTVDCADGISVIKDKCFKIVDLPGTYSMLTISKEEDFAKEFLANNRADCVIIVVDSNVLERNLVFALQVLSLQTNAVLCLNLCDEASKNGIIIELTPNLVGMTEYTEELKYGQTIDVCIKRILQKKKKVKLTIV